MAFCFVLNTRYLVPQLKLIMLKKIFLSLLITSSVYVASAQASVDFSSIKLEQKSDYAPAEATVLKVADYILSTPADKNSLDRIKSMQFLMKWMEGTPDYQFPIGHQIVKASNNNPDLLGVYLAAITKFSLENKDQSKDHKVVMLNGFKQFLTYCFNRSNNVKTNATIKKYKAAEEKGELEKVLEL